MKLSVFYLVPLLAVINATTLYKWMPLVFVTEGNHSVNALEYLDVAVTPPLNLLCELPYSNTYCGGFSLNTWLDNTKQVYLYISNFLDQVLFYIVLRNDVIGPTTTDIWFETATVVTSSYPEIGSSLKIQIDRSFLGITAYKEDWVSNSIERLYIHMIFAAFIEHSTWYNVLSIQDGPKQIRISEGIEECWPYFSPGTNVSDTECSNVTSFSSCFICCISRNMRYALTKVGPGDEFLDVCRCYADKTESENNLLSYSCRRFSDCRDQSNDYCVFFHEVTTLHDFREYIFEEQDDSFYECIYTEYNNTIMINNTGNIVENPVYITSIELITHEGEDFTCPMSVTYTPFNHCGDDNPLMVYTMDGEGVAIDDSVYIVNITGLDIFTFGCLNISSDCFYSGHYPSVVKLMKINNRMYQAPTIRIMGTDGYIAPPDWNYFDFPAPSTLQPTTEMTTTTPTPPQTTSSGPTTAPAVTTTSVTTTNNADTALTESTSMETTTATPAATTTSVTTTNNADTTLTESSSTETTMTAATSTSATNNPDVTTTTSTGTESTTTKSSKTMKKSSSNSSTTISELEGDLVKIEHLNQTYICKEMRSYFISSLTVEELLEEVAKLQGNLTVDKQSLSATTRKKTSAVDNRPSAQSIGYVAVIVLGSELALLILLDFRLFVLTFIKIKKAVIR